MAGSGRRCVERWGRSPGAVAGALALLLPLVLLGVALPRPGPAAAAPPAATGWPAGAVDAPGSGATVAGSVAVAGWALDAGAAPGGGTGVDRVAIYLDGAARGDATLGRPRPDVAAGYGEQFAAAGWRYVLDLTGVAPGQHVIEARAHSAVSGGTAVYARTVAVAVPTPVPPPPPAGWPAGAVDAPGSGATVAGSVAVAGWALDAGAAPGGGTGVNRVAIYLDGAARGEATLGQARPDIGAGFGAQFAAAGWSLTLDLAGVAPGGHTLEARAHSTVNGSTAVYARAIAVAGTGTPTAQPTAPPAATPTPPAPSPTPGGPAGRVLFGVQAHLLWHGLDAAAAAQTRIRGDGLTLVRFDVAWDRLEPAARGQRDADYLARIDAVLAQARARGLRPILVVAGTPSWARHGSGSRYTPPDRPEDFAGALGFLAARYAGQPGMTYEVWNEPNQFQFWDAPGGPSAPAYARLLKPAYAAIKAADPAATVLGGSIAFNDHDYLTDLYAQGGVRGYMDGLAMHPYAQGQPPEARTDGYHSFALAVEQLGQVMAAHGDGATPLWITEMGWSTTLVDDATRADYFRRAVALVKGWPRVAAFCAYAYSQEDDYPDLGLIAPDGSATASWVAYTRAAGG